MRVQQEVLSPRVKYGEETDLSPEVLGVRRDGCQSLGCSTEENAVDHVLVLICDPGNLLWDREYNVKIRHV